MKKLSIIVICLFVIGTNLFGQSTSFSSMTGNNVSLPNSEQSTRPLGSNEILVTHSTNQSITSANSVSCNNRAPNFYHAENSYYRVFNLSNDFGISYNFEICRFEFGIEAAVGANGTQPLRVNFYTLNGSFLKSNLTLLGYENVMVADQAGTIFNVELSNKVVVPKGKILVVELYLPDGITTGNKFFIGSNSTVTTSPSYISASTCSVSEPSTTGSIGFPQVNMVMNIYGNAATVPVPYSAIALLFVLIAISTLIVGYRKLI